METKRMILEGWIKVWMYSLLGCLVILASQARGARPRFDTSTDMGLVLVPADAEIESVIFRLRATDQDADFPLIFDITATVTPVVRIENLPCTLYNKICQANVILTRRLTPGRLHDFAVRVRDSKGDSNSMQATISVTNATTQRDKIFPHIPAIIMVPEDTKPGKELDYILVRSNQWSGKPVYIELWQPKELFTIRQRQTPAETRGVITLIGELDFETQSMYTLTIYATDPYTEPKKDTRNIAGLHLVVVVQDVQDVPPIFTLAPPLTKINNTVQPGDVILRVHAEDGDKGVPREVTYGLVSEGNPFTPFFNISETTGEIILARPLEELTQITHVGAPVVLSVVAEEIRRSTMEPPAQATVVEVGLLLGEPGNSPPFFESDNYVAWMDENAEPGSVVTFSEHYSTKVRDEDIGKAGVFALKLDNNNGTFEISPTVAERTANFIITVRDNSLIDYEIYKSLRFKIIAQEVGPATNLSASVPATIFLRDVNDNAPEFEAPTYEVTLSENVTAGTRVVQVHATDKDTGLFGRIQYTRIIGTGSEAFVLDPDTGIITVAMGSSALDRELTASLQLSVEARDEDGKGLRGTVPFIVNLLDVNDNAPIFEMENYQFTLNDDMTNFTMPAIIKAFDADAEPPNNEIRYELIHGNYENKFYLNEITGELFLREPINKVRRTRHNPYQNFATKFRKGLVKVQRTFQNMTDNTTVLPVVSELSLNDTSENKTDNATADIVGYLPKMRNKREDDDVLFTLTARAYDLGVPHMSGVTQVSVMRGPVAGARNVMFVVAGENPDPVKTAETLAAITGGRIVVQEIRPYTSKDFPNGSGMNVPSLEGGKKSIVIARVEPIGGGTSLVDIERIRTALAANGVGVIGGEMSTGGMETAVEPKSDNGGTTNHNSNTNTNTNTNITTINSEEVTIYRAENRLLFWLLIILGLLMLIALIALIICCICPGCPFYMAPRKRRVHSSETLIARSDGRPKRHLHRQHPRSLEATWQRKKQAWSADPTRRNWQFNRRNRRAAGLVSLPGDVHVVDREHEILEKAASLRLRDGPVPMYLTESMRRPDEERIYIEDVEGLRTQGYGVVDIDSLRQHDMERGSDMARQFYVGEEEQRVSEQPKFVREQHFYRDGNAEVLRLVTRGQMEEAMVTHPVHRPQTLVIDQGQAGTYRVDGKDILLQRFIEDQKIRHSSVGQDFHDSLQDIERRSMESHQRQQEAISLQQQQQQQQHQQQQSQQQQQKQQPKILLIPDRLEEDHRQHIEELGPEVQRLIIDHGSFEKTARFETKGSHEVIPGPTLLVHAPMPEGLVEKTKEQEPKHNVNVQHYSIHDLELARQNALLTRLLLERDVREVGAGAMVDSASYLETQSLPGQVAIATQTDRTTATQTELPNRSRSDNDESEEEARMRKKLRSKKRYADGEPRRIRTLWMKSPIKEEDMQYSTEKKAFILRKKMKDVKDNRRISIEADVLREISDSLDENGDQPITARKRNEQDESNSRVESRNEDDNGKVEDSSSIEFIVRDVIRTEPEKKTTRETLDEDMKGKNKREHVVEPSFRILEKEMSSLSRKLSKLAGKKIFQSSNGSETDSQEKIKKVVAKSKKIEENEDPQTAEPKTLARVTEVTKTKRSKSTPRTTVSEYVSTKEQVKIRGENVIESKPRQVYKYRKSQTISTGSSDFEDVLEKPKKHHLPIAQLERQKQMSSKSSHVKLKRQSKVEHKVPMKSAPMVVSQETLELKDTSDSASKTSTQSGKGERESMRIKKYSSGTGEGKSESGSTPSSGHVIDSKLKKKSGLTVDIRKRSTAESSEAYSKTPQEHISKVSSAESVKKVSVDQTVIEIKTEDPVVSDMKMKTVSETVTTLKSVVSHMSTNKKVTDESTKPTTSQLKSSEERSQRESIDMIENKFFTMPAGAMNDFLTHEMNNSTEALQTQHSSVTEGAESIANSVLGSLTMESEPKETQVMIQKEIYDTIKESADTVQKEVPAPNKSTDNENLGTIEVERISQTEPMRDTTSPNVLGKKEVSELIPFEDKSRRNDLTKEKVSEDLKSDKSESTSDAEMINISDRVQLQVEEVVDFVLKENVEEPTKFEEKESVDGIQKDGVLETINLEVEKSLDGIQKNEVVGAMNLDEKKSLDDIQKDWILEATHLEEKKSVDVIRKEEILEPTHSEAEISSDVTQKDELVKATDFEDKNSVDKIPELGNLEKRESILDKRNEEKLEPTILEDKNSSDSTRKKDVTEATKLRKTDHFEEWEDLPKDTKSDADQTVAKRDIVTQQSEDAGMFSDNFDSFCGTDIHPKNSIDKRGSGDEFSYETLQSESSEDQITAEKSTHFKDGIEKDDVAKTIDKSEEISVSSDIETKEKIEIPQILSPETPSPTLSENKSPEHTSKLISSTSTPISDESDQKTNEIKETKTEIETGDAIDIPVAKLETGTEITVEDSSNILEPPAATTESPKIKHIDLESEESQIHTVPIVPLLDIRSTDETNVKLPSDQIKPESEIIIKSSRSSPSPIDIMLETSSQKEFGIADSLFVDAKLLKVPAKSGKEIFSSDDKEEEPQKNRLIDEPKKIEIVVPPVNLVELSRVMLEDADDSDSSEASNKTMLTARPYGTPRHRPISGSDNVNEFELFEDKSIKQPVQTTESFTTERASEEVHEGLGEAGPAIESAMKDVEKLQLEETVQEPREKSPEIQIETKPAISEKVIDETVKLMEDVDEGLPGVISSETQVAEDETNSEMEPAMLTQISDEDIKEVDITATPGDTEKDGALEKVQQLYQIRQEKLPADPDGFHSLPETDKPVKSLDDTKLLDELRSLPRDMMKTAVAATITKIPGAGTKKVTSIGKDPKATVRKRGTSKEDVPKGFRKPVTTTSKNLSPKKDRKVKTMKEESSKIAKQSVVVGQLTRSRDPDRPVRPAELKVEATVDPLSRNSQVRRTWRKVDRPEKDLQQQEKMKVEKPKKVLSKSESEKSINKRSSETRSTQEKLKESRVKKVQEKPRKTEKGKKSVVDSKTEKGKRIEKVHLDQQEIIRSSDGSKNKEVQDIAGVSEEEQIKLLSSVETEKSVIPSPIPQKDDEDHQKYDEQQSLTKESEELSEKMSSGVMTAIGWNVGKESPEHFVEQTQNKEISSMEETRMTPETITTEQKSITQEMELPQSATTSTEDATISEVAKSSKESTITEDTIIAGERTTPKQSVMSKDKAPIEDPTPTKDITQPKQHVISEDKTPIKDPTLTKEKSEPKQPVTAEDKKRTKDPTVTNETPESAEPSKLPNVHDASVAIETSHQQNIHVKTLDVGPLPKKVMKVPMKIMKEAIGTQVEKVEPEIKTITALIPTGLQIIESTEKVEPSKTIMELVETPTSQTEHISKSDNDLEDKKKIGQDAEEGNPTDSSKLDKTLPTDSTTEKTTSPRKVTKHRKESEMTVIESQSRYMEWYKLKREEMERKRQERKDADEEEERPKWLRKSTRQRWFKNGPEDKRIFDPKIGETTPKRKKIKPLVNVESEQLKAIVRQGRALRKAQGDKSDEPQIQIFAPEKPPTPLSAIPLNSRYHHHHHLVQHSEYKYEKMPTTPFYLHPPPAPHSSPQISPQGYEDICPQQYQSLPSDSRRTNEGFDSGIIVQPQQGANKLRHQQLLEKKSVFDIAYSEAAPSHLRSDSTTPPS